MQTKREEKSVIAQTAASLIDDGDTVIITAGTSTALIAKYLIGKKDVHIVTNNTFCSAMRALTCKFVSR